MKKIILLMGAAAVMAGCTKTPEVDNTGTLSGRAVSFSAVHAGGDGSTRVDITDGGLTGLSFKWIAESDKIGLFASDANESLSENVPYVAQTSAATSVFKVISDDDAIYWGSGTHNFYAYYPYDGSAGVNVGAIPVSVPALQIQTDGTPAHLASANFVYAASGAVTESGGAVSLPFKHLFSVVNVQLTSNEDMLVSAVKFRCSSNADAVVAYNKASVDITTGSVTVASDAVKSNEVTLTFDPAVTVGSSVVNGYLLISPGHAGETFEVVAVVGGADKVITTKTVPAEGIPAGVKVIASGSSVKQDGTEQFPYILNTAAELQGMRNLFVANRHVYFELGADIDMNDLSVGGQPHDWVPLNYNNNFVNWIHFDGKGHVIKNLYSTASSSDYAGFFGALIGWCKNTGFVDVNIVSSKSCGPLGGYLGINDASKPGFIENCYATGKVTTNNMGSGLIARIGNSPGYIKDCYSTVDVTVTGGSEKAAGIVCEVRNGTVSNCYSTGTISSVNGKTAGVAYEVQAAGNVEKSIAWNGGITAFGATPGRIAATWAGGLGVDCLAWEGSKVFNGLAAVSITDSSTPASPYHGVSKSAADIKSWVASNWDAGIWNVSGDYPVLNWQYERGDYAELGGLSDPHPSITISGSGTEAVAYNLKSAYDLLFMRPLFIASTVVYFELNNDIDMNNLAVNGIPYNWEALNWGNNYVNWVHFDGKGHAIRNFYSTTTVNNQGYGGFFGVLIGDCVNTAFLDVNISSPSGKSCGVLAGYLGLRAGGTQGGRIENCYATGKITTANIAGGLTARVGGPNSWIRNCYSDVDIAVTGGTEAAGGIAAYVYRGGEISNCYSTGEVKSVSNRVGGIAAVTEAGDTGTPAGGNIASSIAWNSNLTATGATPGRIVHTWNGNGTGINCFTWNGMKLYDGADEVTGIEDSASPATPYHGVAKSAADLKTWIGANWDGDIWNVSGEYPTLKVFE